MAEFRTILQDASRTLPAPRRGMDDLLRLQTRKRRNKRITAGVVALVVAAAGTLTAFVAFGPANGRPSDIGREGFFAVWPEQLQADAEKAQARVDRGEDPWRLSEAATAQAFVRQVLGWPNAVVDRGCIQDAVKRFTPIPTPQSCSLFVSDRLGTELGQILVEQTVRPGRGGIWSVTSVWVGQFSIYVSPGDEVALGSTVSASVTTETPENYTQVAGVIVFTSCGPQRIEGEAVQSGIAIGTTGLESCATHQPTTLDSPLPGLAFVFRTGVRLPAFGQSLDVPLFLAFGRSDIRVFAMSMVPVVVLPAAPGSSVTGPPSPSLTPPATSSPSDTQEVDSFVYRFMSARLAGSGAEGFLSPEAQQEYSNAATPLYLTGEPGIDRFDYTRTVEPRGDGYAAVLTITHDHGEGTLESIRQEFVSIARSDSSQGYAVTRVEPAVEGLCGSGQGSPCWRLYLVATADSSDPAIAHARDQLRAQGFQPYSSTGAGADAGDGSAQWPTSYYWAVEPYPSCEQGPVDLTPDGKTMTVIVDFTSEADAFSFADALDFQSHSLVQVRVFCQD